jgi:hypothetical protein
VRGLPPTAGLSDECVPRIKAEQPYDGRNVKEARRTPLARLSHFSNIDKHRVLHAALPYMADETPNVYVDPPARIDWYEWLLTPGQPLEHDAVVARLQVQVPPDFEGPQVGMGADFPTSVAFGPAPRPNVPLKVFSDMLHDAAGIVGKFRRLVL